jgi:hypothetical protein
MVMETVRGKEVNAVKITYGCGTVPAGAWRKAYRLEEEPPGGVGRLLSGEIVEERGGNVGGGREAVEVNACCAGKTDWFASG